MFGNLQVDNWQHWRELRGDELALIDNEVSYNWRQLGQLIEQQTARLSSYNLLKGELICLMGNNSLGLLVAYLAALEAELVPAIIALGPKAVLDEKRNRLYAPNARQIVWDFSQEASGRIWISEGAASPITSDKPCAQLGSVIFTSGSSGQPKAIVHTVSQHLYSADGLLQIFNFNQCDRWLLSLPMFHVSGLAIVWRWLYRGAVLVIGGYRELIENRHQVSHASLVATQLHKLLQASKTLSVTRVLLGGSAISNTLIAKANQVGLEVWFGYGMTEAASTMTLGCLTARTGPIDCGTLLPHRQLSIDSNQIAISGKTLAIGQLTGGHLRSLPLDNGRFATQDLGKFTPDGRLMVMGRADNMFISGGENIHCEQIESVLMSIDGVEQAVVLPVKDIEFGCRAIAFIAGPLSLEPSEIEGALINKLERFKHPIAYFRFPTELTSSGIKPARAALAHWFRCNVNRYTLSKNP